jgi:mannose-6-phosphate isomerase-like protein (cupin superfamily)
VLPHTHLNEDGYSFVLEGEIGVVIGENEFRATPGTYILKSPGVPHTLWNPEPQPARILEIICPAGFEGHFDEWPRYSRRSEDCPTSARCRNR